MTHLAALPVPVAAPVPGALRGFTITELMVTLVIISVGLIGLASLETSGLFMNNSSLQRVKASYKAYEMADRMRANQLVFTTLNTGYLTQVDLPHCAAGVAGSFVTDCTSGTAGCTPQQIAQNDLCEWRNDLALQLPNGSGTVCVDSTPDDGSPANPQCDGIGPSANGVATVYAVKVWWSDDKTATAKRFITTVRP